MTSRPPLPAVLPDAFAVHEAAALGVTPSRLRAADLRSPFWGARLAGATPDTFEAECRALATRFRDGDAFTSLTAARLWGMPLPPAMERDPRYFVSSHRPSRSMQRRAVVGSQRAGGAALELRGIPVLPAAEVPLSLGTMLTTEDLIAVIDFLLTGDRGRLPLCSRAEFDAVLAVGARRPGVASFRRAMSLARVGAWSRPETILRLRLQQAGLPEPELNVPLLHPSGRRLIPDLAWPQFKVAAEYNGAHHDEPDQRVHDLRRVDDFTDIGWISVNVEKVELFQHPDSVIRRVTARLRSRGALELRPFAGAGAPRPAKISNSSSV